MKTQQLVLAVLLAAALSPAMADDLADPAQEARREVRIERIERAGPAEGGAHMRIHADGFAFAGDGGHMVAGSMRMPRQAVKNAPYSAEAVTERLQVLADGNQISKKHSTMSFRDSQGRTRQEIRGDDGDLRTILIQDGSTTLVLNPESKTGTRLTPEINKRAGELAAVARERARVQVERLRREGGKPGERGEGEVVRRFEHIEPGSGERAEEVRVRVIKKIEGKVEQLRSLAPIIARASADSKFARNATVRELGSRNFEGVRADGKMSSYEIPAGEVGNARPIVVTDEIWTSPELQMVVYSKHSDPRSGDRIYRLENIRRGEPSAELFTAPADFKIRDAAEHLKQKIEEKAIKREQKAKDKQ